MDTGNRERIENETNKRLQLLKENTNKEWKRKCEKHTQWEKRNKSVFKEMLKCWMKIKFNLEIANNKKVKKIKQAKKEKRKWKFVQKEDI